MKKYPSYVNIWQMFEWIISVIVPNFENEYIVSGVECGAENAYPSTAMYGSSQRLI